MTTPSPIKITIIEGDFSDLLPLLITLLPQQRDESGRRPAPPFSSPFPRGFRVGTLEDLFQDLRETPTRHPWRHINDLLRDLASEGPDESERMRAYRDRDARGPKTTGATEAGDDTPPEGPQGSEGEPEGREEPQGDDPFPGDDPSFPPSKATN